MNIATADLEPWVPRLAAELARDFPYTAADFVDLLSHYASMPEAPARILARAIADLAVVGGYKSLNASARMGLEHGRGSPADALGVILRSVKSDVDATWG